MCSLTFKYFSSEQFIMNKLKIVNLHYPFKLQQKQYVLVMRKIPSGLWLKSSSFPPSISFPINVTKVCVIVTKTVVCSCIKSVKISCYYAN